MPEVEAVEASEQVLPMAATVEKLPEAAWTLERVAVEVAAALETAPCGCWLPAASRPRRWALGRAKTGSTCSRSDQGTCRVLCCCHRHRCQLHLRSSQQPLARASSWVLQLVAGVEVEPGREGRSEKP